MKIRPLHDRVIVKRMEEERTSPGGIVIPDAAPKSLSRVKSLQSATARFSIPATFVALDVKAGDTVLFGKYAGTEVKVDGEELLVMKEDDIMAVVEG